MLISADIFFFGRADIQDIFWEMADILYIFRINTRCWGQAYVADKIQSTTSPEVDHSITWVYLSDKFHSVLFIFYDLLNSR